MENTPNSRKYFYNKQCKNTKNQTQEKTIFSYLYNNTATNTMVSKATNIPQKNICRAKRNFEKAGILHEVERRFCKITGHRASYLTTNPALFKKE
jgi:predicted transcriptional regulator